MIYTRVKTEFVKIKNLFGDLEIKDEPGSMLELPFPITINTPYGFKKIRTLFRTEKQKVVTTYFKNNTTLKTSTGHLLRVNGDWKKVDDITSDDIIETKTGTTSVSRKHYGREEVLYDISVEEVHCYYSNGIVSHNSWILCRIGTESLLQGKNVIHFTLELNEGYVNRRYASCLTGLDFQAISKQKDMIKQRVGDMKSQPGFGKLKVKYFPIKTVSAMSIKSHIERAQTVEGIKYDVVIVDYADILRPITSERNSNSYSEAGSIYEELRMIAGELQVPVWSASQCNRCFSLETLVCEEVRGQIKIKDLNVNDKVLTHLGYKTVKTIFPIKSQPVYRIKLKSGKEVVCSINHRFPISHGKIKSIESGLSIGDKVFTKK